MSRKEMTRKTEGRLQLIAGLVMFSSLVLITAHLDYCRIFDACLNEWLLGGLIVVTALSGIPAFLLKPLWED